MASILGQTIQPLAALAQLAADAPSSEIAGYGALLLQMLVSLALVCGLAYLTLRLLRHRLATAARPRLASHGLLRVVARCPLDAQRSLCIAEAAGRFFLLGIGDGQPTLLAELSAEEVRREELQRAQAAQTAALAGGSAPSAFSWFSRWRMSGDGSAGTGQQSSRQSPPAPAPAPAARPDPAASDASASASGSAEQGADR